MNQTLNTKKYRIESLDLLRGLVMIIMALDHTRDFFHYDAFLHDPLDPASTTPFLYFTRWVTNFCAPVFVFLAGTSVFLQSQRKSTSELSTFLFKRGMWLVFVEVFIIGFAWTFDFSFSVFILGVIWAIGVSMICLSFLIRFSYKTILAIGLLIVAGHNVFDYFDWAQKEFWWDMLRNGDFATYPLPDGREVVIIYPFVPWLGLMLMGYCFGIFFTPSTDPGYRKSMLLRYGTGLTLLFFLLRWVNVYGDQDPWKNLGSFTTTAMSFMDAEKYPPSLLYMCITIGPALLFLAFFEQSKGRIARIIQVYGRVPFLYYVLHFYLLHILCMVLFVERGHAITEQTPEIFGIPFNYVIIGEGYSLKGVYLIWILLVAALYPVCHWFSELKKRDKSWWLSYL